MFLIFSLSTSVRLIWITLHQNHGGTDAKTTCHVHKLSSLWGGERGIQNNCRRECYLCDRFSACTTETNVNGEETTASFEDAGYLDPLTISLASTVLWRLKTARSFAHLFFSWQSCKHIHYGIVGIIEEQQGSKLNQNRTERWNWDNFSPPSKASSW